MLTSRRKFLLSLAGCSAALSTPGLLRAGTAFFDSPRKIILDTDTATDDALAILLAVTSPKVKVEAVTITVGNVDFAQETKNALYTLQLAGRTDIPVFEGLSRAITREIHGTAKYIHGSDGMSDSFFPDPVKKPEQEHAIDAIIRLVEQYPNEITIVAIGPLTNVAMALLKRPGIARLIKSIFVVGGTYKFYGNVAPLSSYNIWVDPEAAKIVFDSKVPIVAVGTDVNMKYSVFTDEDYARVDKLQTQYGDFFMKINRIRRVYCKEHQKLNGSNHPDALAMAIFIDPSINTKSIDRYIDIETQGQLTRGAMLIDELEVYHQPANAAVCIEADEAKFKKMVFDTLKLK